MSLRLLLTSRRGGDDEPTRGVVGGGGVCDVARPVGGGDDEAGSLASTERSAVGAAAARPAMTAHAPCRAGDVPAPTPALAAGGGGDEGEAAVPTGPAATAAKERPRAAKVSGKGCAAGGGADVLAELVGGMAENDESAHESVMSKHNLRAQSHISDIDLSPSPARCQVHCCTEQDTPCTSMGRVC